MEEVQGIERLQELYNLSCSELTFPEKLQHKLNFERVLSALDDSEIDEKWIVIAVKFLSQVETDAETDFKQSLLRVIERFLAFTPNDAGRHRFVLRLVWYVLLQYAAVSRMAVFKANESSSSSSTSSSGSSGGGSSSSSSASSSSSSQEQPGRGDRGVCGEEEIIIKALRKIRQKTEPWFWWAPSISEGNPPPMLVSSILLRLPSSALLAVLSLLHDGVKKKETVDICKLPEIDLVRSWRTSAFHETNFVEDTNSVPPFLLGLESATDTVASAGFWGAGLQQAICIMPMLVLLLARRGAPELVELLHPGGGAYEKEYHWIMQMGMFTSMTSIINPDGRSGLQLTFSLVSNLLRGALGVFPSSLSSPSSSVESSIPPLAVHSRQGRVGEVKYSDFDAVLWGRILTDLILSHASDSSKKALAFLLLSPLSLHAHAVSLLPAALPFLQRLRQQIEPFWTPREDTLSLTASTSSSSSSSSGSSQSGFVGGSTLPNPFVRFLYRKLAVSQEDQHAASSSSSSAVTKQAKAKKPVVERGGRPTFPHPVGLVGLENLGNTCYLAAFLQSLFLTSGFSEGLLGMPGPSPRDLPLETLPALEADFAVLAAEKAGEEPEGEDGESDHQRQEARLQRQEQGVHGGTGASSSAVSAPASSTPAPSGGLLGLDSLDFSHLFSRNAAQGGGGGIGEVQMGGAEEGAGSLKRLHPETAAVSSVSGRGSREGYFLQHGGEVVGGNGSSSSCGVRVKDALLGGEGGGGQSTLCAEKKGGISPFVSNWSLGRALSGLLAGLFYSNRKSLNPQEVATLTPFGLGGAQQDTTEVARWLLDQLGGEAEGSVPKNAFGGRWRCDLSCCICKHRESREEYFADVALPVETPHGQTQSPGSGNETKEGAVAAAAAAIASSGGLKGGGPPARKSEGGGKRSGGSNTNASSSTSRARGSGQQQPGSRGGRGGAGESGGTRGGCGVTSAPSSSSSSSSYWWQSGGGRGEMGPPEEEEAANLAYETADSDAFLQGTTPPPSDGFPCVPASGSSSDAGLNDDAEALSGIDPHEPRGFDFRSHRGGELEGDEEEGGSMPSSDSNRGGGVEGGSTERGEGEGGDGSSFVELVDPPDGSMGGDAVMRSHHQPTSQQNVGFSVHAESPFDEPVLVGEEDGGAVQNEEVMEVWTSPEEEGHVGGGEGAGDAGFYSPEHRSFMKSADNNALLPFLQLDASAGGGGDPNSRRLTQEEKQTQEAVAASLVLSMASAFSQQQQSAGTNVAAGPAPKKPVGGVTMHISEKRTSVSSLLHSFLKPEGLQDYTCDGCKRKGGCSREYKIVEAPNHLIIVLNRFSFDPVTMSQRKLSHFVSVDKTLSITLTAPTGTEQEDAAQATTGPQGANRGETASSNPPPVSASSASAATAETATAPAQRNPRPPVPKAHYSLYGAIVHQGATPYSGHYYTVGRRSGPVTGTAADSELSDSSGPWHVFNDSVVSPFDPARLDTDLNGHATAYVLFYKKVREEWPHEKNGGVPPSSSSCVSSPLPRGEPEGEEDLPDMEDPQSAGRGSRPSKLIGIERQSGEAREGGGDQSMQARNGNSGASSSSHDAAVPPCSSPFRPRPFFIARSVLQEILWDNLHAALGDPCRQSFSSSGNAGGSAASTGGSGGGGYFQGGPGGAGSQFQPDGSGADGMDGDQGGGMGGGALAVPRHVF
uniref:USP domain-containing protein n=1 Tax=Chromera velia CCMP2878 TaxID=1169474 RepID=A0A0G4I9U1_9ALVE|eukprot:Cvel_12370.t1-p1 / transcript=Cvel_12370.t1 / gene=Cvel_12370 / organism=Chromera_velia_CCMP2878 / gene_product=hypothetical protein / transcript_product=hypothetical protein / location=Cvel_scaffold807:23125-29706(-) / protein_length=1681 / sequence_SO=supercontig / SO=protein_coding / is_pseudo=false